MKNENRNILLVFTGLLVVFVLFVGYLSYFQLFKATTIADNSYNKRLTVDESSVRRGSIFDGDGILLAESRYGDNAYERFYEYGRLYSHVIGYSSKQYGKTGLERSRNSQLLNIGAETPLAKLKEKVLTQEAGNDLKLTLLHHVQKRAYDQLTGHKGSIVAMNPKTGAVYAMVALPTFNPNTLDADWGDLVNDPESPLLNRSTQGMYTPGSIIKMITATSILENPEVVSTDYDDQGTTIVDGYEISNVNQTAHGEIGLAEALAYSSNTYFADKAIELGSDRLGATFEAFLFNQEIPFDIGVSKSIAPFKRGMSQTSLAAAAFGQGETLTTPLLMAMMGSAVANGGTIVQPYLVDSVISPKGVTLDTHEPKVLGVVATPEIMQEITQALVQAVDRKSKAYLSWTEVAGKTGTAETNKDTTHAWFVGFAPADDPEIVVAVILEEDGTSGGDTAAPIVKEVIAEYLGNRN